MRVAIIGAGVAGLACALTLERFDVETTVFEQADKPGQAFAHVGLIMPVFHRPAVDMRAELKRKFNLELQPLSPVRHITMCGPTVKRDITGPYLGFSMEVSRGANSVAGQLARLYNGPVIFDTRADYSHLCESFDYVVVAAGNREIPGMLGVWQDWLRTWTVGAQVLGEFDPSHVYIWFDRRLCRNGYAYMVPFNQKMASLTIVIPDVRRNGARSYWQDFLQAHNFSSYPMVSIWEQEHIAGWVHPLRLGNTLFVGIAGGFMDNLLGFSLHSSLASGVLAAQDIAWGKSFEQSVTPLRKNMLNALSLRRSIDRFEQNDLDRLVVTLAFPGIREIVYQSRLDSVRAAAKAATWYRTLKARLHPAKEFDLPERRPSTENNFHQS